MLSRSYLKHNYTLLGSSSPMECSERLLRAVKKRSTLGVDSGVKYEYKWRDNLLVFVRESFIMK